VEWEAGDAAAVNWKQRAERAEIPEKSYAAKGAKIGGVLTTNVLKHGETEERRLLVEKQYSPFLRSSVFRRW
jgi:hypothetical protein